MYLKRLEIQGFKTFATRTVFEFRPGITAVVGPNGSGKSNIADAVRWVLGEQSYAALRSKRTEDLLFSGGGRRAPAGLAEVALTIDNADRLLPLHYNEVTITRRATRAGDNEYFINRTRVRLRDVQEAVGPLGGSYTIVNQGLVDAALTLRPEERRRLFEDAAAISVFEARKSDAERKLRETATNLERCADVLADLEPRLRSLKRQAGLARTYRELSQELHTLLLRHYVLLWHQAGQAFAQAEAAEQQLMAELQTHRATQAATTAELHAVRNQLRELREQLGALHAASSSLHNRAETVQRDLAVSNERQAALIRRNEELARSLQDFDLRQSELERERNTINERLAQAEQHLQEQRVAVSALEGELNAHNTARRTAQRALNNAQRAELEASAALAERRKRAEQLATQYNRLQHEQASYASSLQQAKANQTMRQAALDTAQERVSTAEQAAQAATQAAEQARHNLDQLRSERALADEALAQARRALADTEARRESLERLHRSYAGTFAGVKATMQWAEAQGRTGFTLVASIIHTPAHLEIALEVALGSRLQNIVVEQWSDAEDAIAALKRGGQGRATFLPLDTIRRGSDERRPTINNAGVLGFAIDLIDFDPHYQPVVLQLLGRTLIVEDLPTARQTLHQLPNGWMLVTLAGEQVNSGGAVTGGAQTKDSGTLRRERELRELPVQIAAQHQKVEHASQARSALDVRFASTERAVREAEGLRQRANQERETQRDSFNKTRRELDQALTDLDLHQRRSAQVSTAIHDLAEQQEALQAEQQQLIERETTAREQLAQLRHEDQGRAEAEREVQQRMDTLRANAASAEGEARAERALLQSNRQNIERLAEQRAATMQRIHDLAQERTLLETQLQALQTSQIDLLTQIDMLRAQIGPAEAELNALETIQAKLEHREADNTTALLAAESAYNHAHVEVQRANDRRDTIWERAAADNIDIEAATAQPLAATDMTYSISDSTDRAIVTNAAESLTSLEAQIQNLKTKIQRLGVINPLALDEYDEASARYTFLTGQIDDLQQAEAALRELIAELDEAMQARFETTFHAVAAEFERSFTRLFGGGHAQLQLIHPANNSHGEEGSSGVHSLGVDIIARPPGKRQQTLALLSGGERTLTAAALLFAILKVNPSPFCVLDEVDAALDEANVGRFRDTLTDLSEQTQFLLVTHNRGTIEAADTIYGVSMGEDGASKVLSLRLEELLTE